MYAIIYLPTAEIVKPLLEYSYSHNYTFTKSLYAEQAINDNRIRFINVKEKYNSEEASVYLNSVALHDEHRIETRVPKYLLSIIEV